MRWTRSEAATAEAKKAEGASCTALRTPSPPIFTGRVACVHAGSSSPKWMFVIPLRDDFRSPSYSCSTGERKQGAVLRLYKSFGRAKECFRRRMASWAGRSWSLSPILLSMSVLDVRMSEMEDTSPTGDPSKVAFAGSTIWAPGRNCRMELTVSGSSQMISDFSLLSCNHIRAPSRSTTSRSCLRFSTLPPRVPSSR